jgi:prohibitin 1
MLLFIIFVVASVVLFGFGSMLSEEGKFRINLFSFLLPILALPILLFGIFATVPANSVAIVFDELSGVKQEIKSEGIHIKSIFEHYNIIPTDIKTKEVKGLTGQTKDAQWIKIEMDVKYRVSRQNALKVFLDFRTLDNVADSFITPIAQRSIESVTTKYNVIEVLGEKRNEVYTLIETEVKNRLAASGIEFVSLVLTDTDAGTAIEAAIEQEAVAKKAVETALQVQARAQIEADTKVIQAEAAARVAIIEAQAQADANILLSKSITPEILNRMEMEARIKWGWITITGAEGLIIQPGR